MPGISEFVREEEESNRYREVLGESPAPTLIEPEQVPEGQQRVDIGELLIAMKHAIEKMSVRNTHRGVMTTAGSVIIHLVRENQRLIALLEHAINAGEAEQVKSKPLVELA